MNQAKTNSPQQDAQGVLNAILEQLQQMQTRQGQAEARQAAQEKRIETSTRNMIPLEETFEKQLREIRKFTTQIGVPNHSERERRTSDVTSSDEKDVDAEEVEDRHYPSTEPPITDNTMSKACEMIRIIEPLHGRDDMGVKDFIKKVQLARSFCAELALLLQLILAEKVLGQGERSIRYTKIDTYAELFDALRTQVSIPVTVNGCRDGLRSTMQGSTDSVQAFSNRFRQNHSELQYAVQSRYKGATSRRIAIQEANEEALHIYIANLQKEIGLCSVLRYRISSISKNAYHAPN